MRNFSLFFVSIIVLNSTLGYAKASKLPAEYEEIAEKIIAASMGGEPAWKRLEIFCNVHPGRISGSKILEQSIYWVKENLQANGIGSVSLQPVNVPHWVRGNGSLSMTSKSDSGELAMLALGMSVGTAGNTITAPAVVVKSFAELNQLGRKNVEGKIVVFNVPFTTYGETGPYRWVGADRSAALGAKAMLVRSVASAGSNADSPHTGSLSYSDAVPRIPAAALSFNAADRIQKAYDAGDVVTLSLNMSSQMQGEKISHNVIAQLPGQQKPEEIVAFGGHIDSWDVGQGAHDDGAAIIATMEALMLLQKLIAKNEIPAPRRTLRLVHWTNEENGGRGAKQYFKNLTSQELNNHVAALEMDFGAEEPAGFGFSAKGQGSQKARETMANILQLVKSVGASKLGANGSGADIDALIQAGVPGLAVNTVGTNYFDWHHSVDDKVDKVDPQFLQQHVAAIAVVVYVLADMQKSIRAIAENK